VAASTVAVPEVAAAPTLTAAMPEYEPDAEDIPEFDELFVPENEQVSTEDEKAAETATVIEEVVQAAEASTDEVFMLGQTTKKPDALNIPVPPQAAETIAEQPVEQPVEQPAKPEAESAAESVATTSEEHEEDSVFMLGSQKSKLSEEATTEDQAEEVAPAPPVIEESAEAEPEAVTVPAEEPAATGSSGNIFMLNKPQ